MIASTATAASSTPGPASTTPGVAHVTVVVAPAIPPALVDAITARIGAPQQRPAPCPAAPGLQVARWAPAHVDQDLRERVAAACGSARADHAFVPASNARLSDHALLAMDMDSTVITIECIDEIGDWCGRKAQIAEITEATMRGEIKDFSESLRRRVALLAGVEASALEAVYEQRLRLSPGAETMLAAARRVGLKTLLVSGGFTFFTERLRERLGLDFTRANVLEIADGRLTGRVLGDIVDAEVKAAEVAAACARLGVPASRAIAMGDGANDLKMLALAGLGVAYHAKPVVAAQADVAIRFGGLDTLAAFLA